MPLDTSIALNANAPAPMNPLQTALQVAQYRAYNANGLAAQQQLDANNAASDAFKQATDASGNTDYNKFRSIMAGSGVGYNLPQINKSILDAQQAQQTLDRGSIGLSNDKIDNAKKMFGTVTQRLGSLDPQDPQFAAHAMDLGHQLVNQFGVDPQMVIHELSTIPQDPAGRAAWRNSALASLQDAGSQLKSMTPTPTLVDDGMTKRYLDTNAISNPGIIGTSVQNQLTPESATSPVGVMGPNNTPGVVPRGEMWGNGVSGAGTPQINVPPLPTAANQQGAGQAVPMPGQAAPAGGPAHFVATGTPMGASGVADDAGKRYGALQQAAQQAKPLMQTYDLAAQALKSTIAGKGANAALNVPALLNTFGIQAGTDAVKNNQLLANYLNSAADQAAASLGLSGSDSRLAAAKAGQPDPNNMNGPALLDSINHVKGLQQAVLDRQQATTNFLAQNGNSTAALPQFEAKWNQSFNPDVSYIRSLGSPEDQQAAMQKLKASGHLKQWTKDYQAMKALGAF
jgi:hypothetical protein